MGEVSTVVGGGTPKTDRAEYFGGDIPWITPADLSGYSAKFISAGSRSITEAGLAGSGATMMPAGAVLFSSRAPIGYVAIASQPVATNQGFKSFVLGDELSPDFVYYYLQHAKHLAVAMASGTTFLEISGKKAAQLPVPIPPLVEQRQIVADIEAQFTRLDAGIEALRRVQANLQRYRAAVLKAACEGRLAAANGDWPMKRLSTAIETMDQGWSPKCDTDPSTDAADWAVIKTTAVQHRAFVENENKRLPDFGVPRDRLELRPGDLLVTRAGPRSRVGVTCLIRSTRPRLMLCDKVYRLRCNSSVADPAFLEMALNSPNIIDDVDQMKTGMSDSGVNLTQSRFGELLIPLPSLPDQMLIVAVVDRTLSVSDQIEANVAATLLRAQRLRQACLRKAFRGDASSTTPGRKQQ